MSHRRTRSSTEEKSSCNMTSDTSACSTDATDTAAAAAAAAASIITPQNNAVSTKAEQQQEEKGVTIRLPNDRQLIVPDAPADLLDKCSEDDPAIVFDWNDNHTAALLPHFQGLAAVPAWIINVEGDVAGNITAKNLKDSIIAQVRIISIGNMKSFGNTIIAPLTLQEFGEVKDKIVNFSFEPNMVAAFAEAGANAGAIATLYFIADASRPANAKTCNVAVPQHGGVRLFV